MADQSSQKKSSMQMKKRNRRTPITRPWTQADLPGVVACHRAAYPEYAVDDSHYDVRTYAMQLQAFPEGQLLIDVGGIVAAYATSLVLRLKGGVEPGTYDELTSDGSFRRHTLAGDTLYGADLAVHPDFRGQGLSRLLYRARRALLLRLNLRRMVAYGRIPGYRRYADRLTAREYVRRVICGDLRDPALNTHLRAGYHVKEILRNPDEEDSVLKVCTLLELPNPFYDPPQRALPATE
jgi:GNAT superfamily N-acetyltransferase